MTDLDFGDLPIDLNAEPKNMDFECLPKGRYKQQIVNIKVEQKDSGSVMVYLESEILDAAFLTRKVWTSINIVKKDGNPNDLGNKQLSALSKACGFDSIPKQSTKLIGIPHIASIAVEKSEDPAYPNDKNKMTGFYPLPSAGKQIIAEKIKEQESDQPDFLR